MFKIQRVIAGTEVSGSALYKGRKVASSKLGPATNVIIKGVSKDMPFFVSGICGLMKKGIGFGYL